MLIEGKSLLYKSSEFFNNLDFHIMLLTDVYEIAPSMETPENKPNIKLVKEYLRMILILT